MLPSLLDFLRHIEHECGFVFQIANGKTKEELFGNEILSKALCRSLEIIGEATKKLPVEFKDQHPQIEWGEIAGMRDVIIHDYFGIDYETVWSTITKDIPDLRREIKRIIEIESPK